MDPHVSSGTIFLYHVVLFRLQELGSHFESLLEKYDYFQSAKLCVYQQRGC